MGNLANFNEVMYHIGLSKKMIAKAEYAVLPGDPGRVEMLAKAFGEAEFIASHREYTSWLTHVNNQPILVCSTGMGGPSVSIGIEELAKIGIKKFIRVGTTGSIQERIKLGELVINNAAVRLDGASRHYAPIEFPAVASLEVTNALAVAADEIKVPYHVGISVSSDTFWPGQERYDSFTGYVPRALQGSLQEWQALGACNYEMETATLFVFFQSMGLAAGSICGVVAQRTQSEHVAGHEIYQLASERFISVVKRTLFNMTKEGK